MDGQAAALYLCRFLLAGTFLLSALPKLRDQASFRAAVRQFRVVPRAWEGPTGWALTAAELAVPLLLVLAPSSPAGFVLAALLLLAFSIGIARVLRSGVRTTCNCFGRSAAVMSGAHVARNGVLLVVAVTGAVLAGATAPDLGVMALLSLFGVALLTAVYFFDDLVLALSPERTG